jgi:hypothetical protein
MLVKALGPGQGDHPVADRAQRIIEDPVPVVAVFGILGIETAYRPFVPGRGCRVFSVVDLRVSDLLDSKAGKRATVFVLNLSARKQIDPVEDERPDFFSDLGELLEPCVISDLEALGRRLSSDF